MIYYIINHNTYETEGCQSSVDGSDNNFNFNDDYVTEPKSSFGYPFSYSFFILIFR